MEPKRTRTEIRHGDLVGHVGIEGYRAVVVGVIGGFAKVKVTEKGAAKTRLGKKEDWPLRLLILLATQEGEKC